MAHSPYLQYMPPSPPPMVDRMRICIDSNNSLVKFNFCTKFDAHDVVVGTTYHFTTLTIFVVSRISPSDAIKIDMEETSSIFSESYWGSL